MFLLPVVFFCPVLINLRIRRRDAGERTGNFTLGYDANGSVTKKITWDTKGTSTRSDDTKVEEITYEYNLQNRLAKVTTIDYITPRN